jgi:hypothetical protein
MMKKTENRSKLKKKSFEEDPILYLQNHPIIGEGGKPPLSQRRRVRLKR